MIHTHAIIYRYDDKTYIFLVWDVRETPNHVTATGYRLLAEQGERYANYLTFAPETIELVAL